MSRKTLKRLSTRCYLLTTLLNPDAMFRNGLALLVALLICALPSSAQEKFSKTFGGDRDEHAMAVTTTATGDYVVAGFTNSYGLGKSDVWVMKLDDFGNEVWRQYFGDKDYDWANDLIETRDGNYVLAGYTRDQKSGKNNAWVFQLNRHGELMWSRTYGGKDADEARSIIQTKDGGFAVAGFSYSNSKGKSDIWLLRLNAVEKSSGINIMVGAASKKPIQSLKLATKALLLVAINIITRPIGPICWSYAPIAMAAVFGDASCALPAMM